MKESLILVKVMLIGMIHSIEIEENKYDYENEPRWTYRSYTVKNSATNLIDDIDYLLEQIDETM